MYAQHGSKKRFNPAAFGGALLINGGLLAVLATMGVATYVKLEDPILETYPVPIDPPPPPVEPDPKPVDRTIDPQPAPQPVPPVAPEPRVNTTSDANTVTTTTVIPPDLPPLVAGKGPPDSRSTVIDPPAPILAGAEYDPRYHDVLQPDYPAREQARQVEGKVTLKVLIGADGRVKQVEQVNAESPGFFEATRRQALRAWRFKPATRNGVPYESWKTMTVRFVLDQG